MKARILILGIFIFISVSLLGAQTKGVMCKHNMMGNPKESEITEPERLKHIETVEELGLTDEQIRAITDLRLDFLRKTADKKAQLEIKKAELKALWMGSEPNKDAILKKVKEINDLKGDIELRKAEMRLEIYKILTPDQRKKLGGTHRKLDHLCPMMGK